MLRHAGEKQVAADGRSKEIDDKLEEHLKQLATVGMDGKFAHTDIKA